MPALREIRADYDRTTIVVYQAFHPSIADAAVKAQRFVPPFSLGRMTWIKPSFLWMMERSDWGRRARQERTLAVRIRREAWDAALSEAVLTKFKPKVHETRESWRRQHEAARVVVQWDPERSVHGEKLEHKAIQVGLGRAIAPRYVEDWVVRITDVSPLVHEIHTHLLHDELELARALLPSEQPYEVDAATRRRLGM